MMKRRSFSSVSSKRSCSPLFGSTYTKIGTIQRRLARPLRKDDTQIREASHIFAGRDWGQEEKGTTEDEMAGWHHGLDGRESE